MDDGATPRRLDPWIGGATADASADGHYDPVTPDDGAIAARVADCDAAEENTRSARLANRRSTTTRRDAWPRAGRNVAAQVHGDLALTRHPASRTDL